MWTKVKDSLKGTFSLYQFMELMGLDRTESKDKREARNILNQLYKSRKIYRLSKNVYKKREILSSN
ncbi:MAG: hypothetical protein HWN67_09635 [Candidatus Helarchaeota archaeon]|nr:hypothetical protein [Candidatus Helarchaeota archaeon]